MPGHDAESARRRQGPYGALVGDWRTGTLTRDGRGQTIGGAGKSA